MTWIAVTVTRCAATLSWCAVGVLGVMTAARSLAAMVTRSAVTMTATRRLARSTMTAARSSVTTVTPARRVAARLTPTLIRTDPYAHQRPRVRQVGLTQARLQLERGGRNLGRGLRPIREIGVCSAPVHAACRGHWQCQPATGSATGSLPGAGQLQVEAGPGPC